MPIYYVDTPHTKFDERILSNGTFRYNGYFHTIHYCIDSKFQKTEDQINDFLESKSVDYLIDNENYIIHI